MGAMRFTKEILNRPWEICIISLTLDNHDTQEQRVEYRTQEDGAHTMRDDQAGHSEDLGAL
jgi:hypothetical protein